MASLLLLKGGTRVRSIASQLSSLSTQTSALLQRHIENKFYERYHYCSSNSSSDDKRRCVNENIKKNATNTNELTETDSTKLKNSLKSISDSDIKKSVFISQSYDIFTNLALEDWFYRNFDFTNHHVLLLWSNDPCVVFGRHQNPFDETNVSKLLNEGIALARRNSGGGTVYHDRGNMNMTFFTPRKRYNRNYNLNIITRALFREWGIKADISTRDDILINNKKISGTAAKLGQPNAYHHCTLLVNSNKDNVRNALLKNETNIIGKATPSVRSPIKNLVDFNRHVNFSQLLSAIGYEFLRTSATELHDGGRHLMMKQRGFQLINPTEKWFPGLNRIQSELSSWNWCFGKTPSFTVQKDLQLKSDDKDHDVQLNVDVNSGLIEDIFLTIPNIESIPVLSILKGKPYCEENLHHIVSALKGVSGENVKHAMNHSL